MKTRHYVLPAVLFALALGVRAWWPDATAQALCIPAARAAAAFLHLPLLQGPGAFLALDHPLGHVVIARGCSGTQFLGLLLAIGAWTLLNRLPLQRALWWVAAFIPIALLVTLTANTMRIVFAVFAQEFSLAFFPEGMHRGMHTLAGITIFLPTLFVVCFLIERITARAYRQTI